jgi:hypothetical protein
MSETRSTDVLQVIEYCSRETIPRQTFTDTLPVSKGRLKEPKRHLMFEKQQLSALRDRGIWPY